MGLTENVDFIRAYFNRLRVTSRSVPFLYIMNGNLKIIFSYILLFEYFMFSYSNCFVFVNYSCASNDDDDDDVLTDNLA